VDDKGTGGGAAFDGIDAGDGLGIESVSAESVNRLGRKSDKAAAAKHFSGAGNLLGGGDGKASLGRCFGHTQL
jgi:hypothetical protein